MSKDEKCYQTTMTMVKKLLQEGVITAEDYLQIDTIFKAKYSVSLGGLLFDIKLINPPIYGNM